MRQTPTRFFAFAAAAFFTIAAVELAPPRSPMPAISMRTLAFEQNQLNQSGHCRFTGARWSNDTSGHRAWCRAAGPSAAIRETEARNALTACFQTGNELNMIQLQSLMSKRQTAVQLLTNMLKALNNSQKNVINNMR